MQRRSQNQKILNLLDSLQGLSICLIGMMGSGKSTIGKELSIQLNYRFFDTDILIEQVIGRKIPDIFATDGEAQFRDWESQILSNVTACTRSVIATGGGAVTTPRNWSYLHQTLVIWLDAPVELLVQRLRGDQGRPLLSNEENIEERLNDLIVKRRDLYSQADLIVKIAAEEDPQQVTQHIIEQIPSVLKTTESTKS